MNPSIKQQFLLNIVTRMTDPGGLPDNDEVARADEIFETIFGDDAWEDVNTSSPTETGYYVVWDTVINQPKVTHYIKDSDMWTQANFKFWLNRKIIPPQE